MPQANASDSHDSLFAGEGESTRQVIAERRLRTLHALATQTKQADSTDTAMAITLQILAQSAADTPFVLLYQIDESKGHAQLVGATGLAVNTPASPTLLPLDADNSPWPLVSLFSTNALVCIHDVADRFGPLVCDPWPEPLTTALALPITAPGRHRPAGMMVVGVSPRHPLDADYQSFLELIARQVSTTLTDARADETERLRTESLAAIERAKTTFFSNLSHEFRTPLTQMLTATEEALADQNQPLPPAQQNRMETTQRNGLRLLKLVNTLLDFSHIEAGRIHAHYEPTDLAALTTDLTSAFRRLVERGGLALKVTCPPLPAPAYVDRDMWEKIVLNLLSNAFKFTLAGEISVALRWCESEAEVLATFTEIHRHHDLPMSTDTDDSAFSSLYPSYSPTILLTVCDTGTGIPSAELSRLFERFHQVAGVQGRSVEGTGIGLALVQELVKLHGGSVSVVSRWGQGSCFTIAIPAGHGHLPSDRLYHGNQDSPNPERPQSRVTSYLEEAGSWLPESADNLPPEKL